MDKILYGIGRNEGQVQVTNDGATILKAVGVDNPCAKVLVDMSKVQDDEVSESKFDKKLSKLVQICLNLRYIEPNFQNDFAVLGNDGTFFQFC